MLFFAFDAKGARRMNDAVTLTLPQAIQHAAAAFNNGEWAKAEHLARLILNAQADNFDALNLLGIMAAQTRRPEEAADLFRRAVAARPTDAAAHSNYGNSLNDLKRFEEALDSYSRALKIKPDFAEAYFNRGNVLRELKRFEEALDSYACALKIKPNDVEVYSNRGVILLDLKRFEEALDSFACALKIKPDFAEAYNNRGLALQELKRFEEALDSFANALKIRADFAEAYNNRGLVLKELKRFEEALDCFASALKIRPDFADAYNSRGLALQELKHFEEALDCFASALKIRPDFAEAYNNRGLALRELKRFEEALDSYAHALQVKPDCDWSYGNWLHLKLSLCDWSNFDSQVADLAAKIQRAEKTTPPFPVLSLIDRLSLHRQAAEIWVSEKCPPSRLLPAIAKRARHQRIRIGYFSGDYRNHPVSFLTAEMFERHDRSRFEVIAFSFGPDTQDEMRRRMERAFDRFIDVRGKSDLDIVHSARRMELDIAVDLGGFTEGCRPNLFALRSAPLQVGYLGYPGTSGSDCMDYLAADLTLIPREEQRHYSEKIIYLPGSYQVNDSTRAISDSTFTREEFGLPPADFVFCCFNASYKIVPACFDAWMHIVIRVPDSVLWLSDLNSFAKENLRREAERRGVSAERLVFAQRMPSLADHLARQRLADLFLDTLPYNAHTTASDALWAGLPVLTHMGESFAARVAASLLNGIGLPELVTSTQEQYEAMAIELASNPDRLAEIKDRLHRNRLEMPLFDTGGFTTHLENAYTQIYERYQADLSPEHIYVAR
jgi:predicted O-linked N-acetylglucosamine transferase (SPINDLY family)